MSTEFKLVEDTDTEEDDDDDDYEISEFQRAPTPLWKKADSIVSSRPWHYLVGTVITINIVLMALEAQYPKVRRIAKPFGLVESSFLAFFLFEISIRLYVFGCRGFFLNADVEERHWNWGDFTIVSLGLASYAIRPSRQSFRAGLEADDNDGDTWSHLLLLLRGLRIIRVIRLFKRLRQLQGLIRGMFKSFEAVFWILVLGFLIILFFAVAVTTIVGNHADLWSLEKCPTRCERHDEERITELFGDLGLSMWTMFQFVTLDQWADIIHLVSKRMWFMRWIFLLYTLIASFALISLLTGVMAEHIMSESQQTQKMNGEQDINQYIALLQKCFAERDSVTHGDGLTYADLSAMLAQPKVVKLVKRLRLETVFKTEELKDAFHAMDLDGNGMITWEEFHKGLSSITGEATARDLCLVRADVQRLLRLFHFGKAGSLSLPPGWAPAETQGRPRAAAAPEEPTCAQRMGALEERMARLEASILQLARSNSQASLHQVPATWQQTPRP